jgi:hypothetical protein
MIAEEIGVDEGTVRKARSSTAEYSAVAETLGRDGKRRPAKRLKVEYPDPNPEVVAIHNKDVSGAKRPSSFNCAAIARKLH